jgi:hypothetical protein
MKSFIKHISLGVVVLVGVTACDVNRLPETNISDATFWRSEADLKSAANYLYTFLPGFNTEDVWSDDAVGLASNNISDGSRLAPATDGNYNTPYTLIRAANNIIEKAPLATSAGQVVIDRYVAEARFYRAWAYFSLVQKYGDVPLILKTLDDTSPELTAPATSRAEIYTQIYQDLDFAANKLPTPTALGAADYGRISNTAALAFKGRVALFEGTRAKFHNYGDANMHLSLAVAASKAVMDSKQHDLLASYFNLFQYEGEGRQNRENIIVRQYGVTVTERVSTHAYFRTSLENGNLSPTKSLADSYLMKDGLPITKSPLYKAPAASLDVFANRDERMSATFMKRGDAYMGTKPVFDVAPLVFNKTGFTFRKYSNVDDWTTQNSLMDRAVLRYGEVLLTYAEAKFELEGQISDADLEISINLLRNRAKVDKLSNGLATANGLDMREELRRERRVELAQESFRYWDLIRWKTAEIELPKPVLGNYFFKDEFGTAVTVNLTPDNFLLVQNASFRKFDPGKDYLWPMPINEISLNSNLKQNPKW